MSTTITAPAPNSIGLFEVTNSEIARTLAADYLSGTGPENRTHLARISAKDLAYSARFENASEIKTAMTLLASAYTDFVADAWVIAA